MNDELWGGMHEDQRIGKGGEFWLLGCGWHDRLNMEQNLLRQK